LLIFCIALRLKSKKSLKGIPSFSSHKAICFLLVPAAKLGCLNFFLIDFTLTSAIFLEGQTE
jgi:hypothetical protein